MTINSVSPNIILILMDATRADRLSCYGYERPTTPHIDRIASEGVLYRKAFAPDVWTLPVVPSIFTGLMPHEHGVGVDHPFLAPNFVTLAELLSEQGYITWGASSNGWVNSVTQMDRGFSQFVEVYRLLSATGSSRVIDLVNRFYAKYILGRYDKGAHRINKAATQWLKQRQVERVDTRPFFMFLHYMEPHYPYRPPRPFDSLYIADRNLASKARKINHHPLEFFAGKLALDETDYELLNCLYDAEITYMDLRLGELYKALEALGLLDTTAIILFGDHGENIGDHGLLDHHFCLYDTLIHVPLIIRHPLHFARGEQVDQLVETRDIFRTVLELAGLNDLSLFGDTRSLLVEKTRSKPREYVVAETSGMFVQRIKRKSKPVRDLSVYDQKLQAVRTHRYKYIQKSDGPVELYDLLEDPQEQFNRADQSPHIVAALQQIMDQEFQSLVQTDSEETARAELFISDPAVSDRLRALGYVE